MMLKHPRVFPLTVVLASVAVLWLCLGSAAQTSGNNAVYSGTTTSASTAYIDAAGYAASITGNMNICQVINSALLVQQSANGNSPGAVVDARGLIPNPPLLSFDCTANLNNGVLVSPFDGIHIPSTVILPGGSMSHIKIGATWVMPSNTRLMGVAANMPIITVVSQPSTSNSIPASMIQMCAYGSACSGISIEHLQLDGGTTSGNNIHTYGIYNLAAQDQSYVNDVMMSNVADVGVYVGSGAAGSGPYTNINFNTPATPGTDCACAQVQAQTRGLRGFTCIWLGSSQQGTGGMSTGAVLIQAGDNTVSDMHFEGFQDGVQIGASSSSSAIANVIVSNITSAAKGANSNSPTVNTVHICGTNSDSTLGACSFPSGGISDVSVLQASNDFSHSSSLATTAVRDDQTGTSLMALTTGVPWSVGLYVLGESMAGAGYSRFTTDPSPVTNGSAPMPTPLPTWGVGTTDLSTSPCNTPGALFTNINGTSATTFVCTGSGSTGTTWQILF